MQAYRRDKEQSIHKAALVAHSLVRLSTTFVQTNFLFDFHDLVGEVRMNIQLTSYSFVAMKNCCMISATQLFADFGQRAIIFFPHKIDGHVSCQGSFSVSFLAD